MNGRLLAFNCDGFFPRVRLGRLSRDSGKPRLSHDSLLCCEIHCPPTVWVDPGSRRSAMAGLRLIRLLRLAEALSRHSHYAPRALTVGPAGSYTRR